MGKVKNKSTAKRNINYRTYPDFITIPANQNQVKYHLKTLSEGNLGDTKSLWINGEASGYKVNTDGINIKNPDRIHIPNVFTPNDDGENDFWIIQGIDFYPKCTVTVYNRWGKKVLFSVGYTQPWDGKQSDQPLPAATYYYVIDLKNGSSGSGNTGGGNGGNGNGNANANGNGNANANGNGNGNGNANGNANGGGGDSAGRRHTDRVAHGVARGLFTADGFEAIRTLTFEQAVEKLEGTINRLRYGESKTLIDSPSKARLW